jgi:hypothetical protein
MRQLWSPFRRRHPSRMAATRGVPSATWPCDVSAAGTGRGSGFHDNYEYSCGSIQLFDRVGRPSMRRIRSTLLVRALHLAHLRDDDLRGDAVLVR